MLPVLRGHPSDVAPLALAAGAPQRATMATGLLEDARKVGENRRSPISTLRYCSQPSCCGCTGAVAVETDLATLLVMAGLHGVLADNIFTVDGNLARTAQPVVEITEYAPDRPEVWQSVASMVAIALRAPVDAE